VSKLSAKVFLKVNYSFKHNHVNTHEIKKNAINIKTLMYKIKKRKKIMTNHSYFNKKFIKCEVSHRELWECQFTGFTVNYTS